MNALAGLMNPGAVGQTLRNEFEQGQQKRQQIDGQNAMTAYAMNPNDPAAFEAIARTNPQMAIQLRGQQDEARKKAMVGQLRAAAAQGDSKAQAALWTEDPDMAMKLDDRQAKKVVEGFEFLGQAAYDIVQRPPEQQAALFDQYIEQAVANGFDGMAQYRGKYSPQLLNTFVAKVDGMKEFMTFQQPKYVPVGEGGLSGFQYGQPIQQGGQAQDFGGPQTIAQAPPPPPGFVVDGGPTQPASGNFPGGEPYYRAEQ